MSEVILGWSEVDYHAASICDTGTQPTPFELTETSHQLVGKHATSGPSGLWSRLTCRGAPPGMGQWSLLLFVAQLGRPGFQHGAQGTLLTFTEQALCRW